MSKKEALIKALVDMGIDPYTVIQETFLGYKYRKKNKILYDSDQTIPATLIKLYYGSNPGEISFNNMKKRFITHYINNESKLEAVDYNSIHGKKEVEGLRAMYEYIHSSEIDKEPLEPFTLCILHKELYSKTEHPEFGGTFRNYPAFLPGTGTELCDSSYIYFAMTALEDEVRQLQEEARYIRKIEDTSELLNYLDKCVVLQCKLVKIHPFGDGNGRTIRCFINKLLEEELKK